MHGNLIRPTIARQYYVVIFETNPFGKQRAPSVMRAQNPIGSCLKRIEFQELVHCLHVPIHTESTLLVWDQCYQTTVLTLCRAAPPYRQASRQCTHRKLHMSNSGTTCKPRSPPLHPPAGLSAHCSGRWRLVLFAGPLLP